MDDNINSENVQNINMYFKTDLDPIGSGLFTDELNIEEGALESQNQNMFFASRREPELCESLNVHHIDIRLYFLSKLKI